MSRFKAVLALCVISSFVNVGVAQAHDGGSWEHKNSYLRTKTIKLHGKRAPGCDLVRNKCEGKKVNSKTVRKYFNTMRTLIAPPPVVTLNENTPVQALDNAVTPSADQSYTAPANTAGPSAGGSLESIANCESGGDPSAVSSSGQYRGKYQFDRQTWGSVGGSGDPAAASEAEQDKRAAMLYAQRGAQPWPVCGR